MIATDAAMLLCVTPALVQDSTSGSHWNTKLLPQDFGTGIERVIQSLLGRYKRTIKTQQVSMTLFGTMWVKKKRQQIDGEIRKADARRAGNQETASIPMAFLCLVPGVPRPCCSPLLGVHQAWQNSHTEGPCYLSLFSSSFSHLQP